MADTPSPRQTSLQMPVQPKKDSPDEKAAPVAVVALTDINFPPMPGEPMYRTIKKGERFNLPKSVAAMWIDHHKTVAPVAPAAAPSDDKKA